MQRKIAAAVAAGALSAPAAASAHVTLQADSAPAGAITVVNVRVPIERDDASTVKVDLQLPHGFVFASYEPRPGWSVKLTNEKLAKPVQTDDGPVRPAKGDGHDGASKGLGFAALAVGALGLVVGLGAFAAARKRLTAV
jgi:uncharacterized protein YcnI